VVLPYLDGRSTTALIDLARDDVARSPIPTLEESS
jgi:hypothetical protein